MMRYLAIGLALLAGYANADDALHVQFGVTSYDIVQKESGLEQRQGSRFLADEHIRLSGTTPTIGLDFSSPLSLTWDFVGGVQYFDDSHQHVDADADYTDGSRLDGYQTSTSMSWLEVHVGASWHHLLSRRVAFFVTPAISFQQLTTQPGVTVLSGTVYPNIRQSRNLNGISLATGIDARLAEDLDLRLQYAYQQMTINITEQQLNLALRYSF